MNSVNLIGRLTRDVELRFTGSGTAVGSFNLAVNRSFKNQAGDREADFVSCVIWRKAAENLAQYAEKGSQIGVEGRIQTRNYDDKDGKKVYVTEVVVNNFHLISSNSSTNEAENIQSSNCSTPKQNAGNAPNYSKNSNSQSPFLEDGRPIDISEDDLPF